MFKGSALGKPEASVHQFSGVRLVAFRPSNACNFSSNFLSNESVVAESPPSGRCRLTVISRAVKRELSDAPP